MTKNQRNLFFLRLAKRTFKLRLRRKFYSRPGVSFHSPKPIFNGPVDFYKNYRAPKIFENLDVPEVFSLTENTDETMNFFEKLKDLTFMNKNIFISWHNTKKVTPDSLLYILSLLHMLKKQKSKIAIRSNGHHNSLCKDLIEQSGFYKYTDIKSKPSGTSENIFAIRKGKFTEREVVLEIKLFCTSKLGIGRFTPKGRAIQSMLLECTTNTNNHAYDDEEDINYWWVLASHEDSRIRITFLDNGIGIPNTVKLKAFMQRFESDADLIKGSLEGSILSSTGHKFRNKGLPKICWRIKQEQTIDKLTVLSDKGYLELTSSSELRNTLKTKFEGTLFQFEITKGVRDGFY